MEIFRRLFKRRAAPKKIKEWISVTFKMKAVGEFGNAEERASVHEFTKRLSAVILERQVGVYDGDEYGKGEGSLYMYGPNADELFDVIRPLLVDWEPLKGGYAIKRYGARERSERIEF